MWVETVPMQSVEGSPGVFAVLVHLPPGYHQYKFIVDGKWRHDETAPHMQDPLGNINNWLFVRKIEPTGPLPPVHAPGVVPYVTQQAAPAVPEPLLQTPPKEQPPHNPGPEPVQTEPVQTDVDMVNAEVVAAPSQLRTSIKEPEFTRKKVGDFLQTHTAYELIPESGQVVVVDLDLPVRQAFHALHEQGCASAPLWDPAEATVIGVISASDFIHILKRLRVSVSSGANPLNEIEMDAHTIRGLREEAALEGREPKQLIYARPEDSLARVVRTLSDNKCSMAPVLSCEPTGQEVPTILHVATLSGVLACIMRHFRTSLASLPLLSQPIQALPIGTWSPDSPVASNPLIAPSEPPDSPGRPGAQLHFMHNRRVQQLHTVHPSTPLTTALSMLLETGVSALPVVDEKYSLLDIYARADITKLCKGNAYNRLQYEDLTVAQALLLNQDAPGSRHPSVHGYKGEQGSPHTHRVSICTRNEQLREVMERLSRPGVRRVMVVDADTRRVEGIVSLSDIAHFLFI